MTLQTNYKKALFKPYDFESADRVERLYMHRLDPNRCKLSEREQKHFNRLRHAMLLLIQPNSLPTDVAYILMSDLGIKLSSARLLIEQVMQVYPDLISNSKQLEKEDAIAVIHQIIQRHRESEMPDDSIILKAIKELREIREWNKEQTTIKPGDIQLPEIIWSDDPSILLDADNGIDDAQNIEFEELEKDFTYPIQDDEF